MKTKVWLTINSKGRCKATKNHTGLYVDEIAIQLNIELPDMLFKKPHLIASITVPNEAAAVETIGAVITDNVRDAIEEATGLAFSISVVTPEETDSS